MIVNFGAAVIGLEDDPFAVRRGGQSRFKIVRPRELERKSAIGGYGPEIETAG